MKILFVNRHTDPVGGVEYYIDALARALKSAGHGAFIIHWDEARSEDVFDGYYRVPELWEDELRLNGEVRRRIDGIIEDCVPDVVYFHKIDNGKAVRYLSERGRSVQYVHDYKTVDPDGKMLLRNPLEPNTYPLSPACFLRAYTRKAMPRDPVKGVKAYLRARGSLDAAKKVGKIVVASGCMRNTLILNGVRPDKVHVLPYFIDYGGGAAEGAANPKGLLYAGRIADGKGVGELLEILGMVDEEFALDVVGSGPEEDRCIKMAGKKRLSDKVAFRGWIMHDNLPQFYRRNAFLVMPSIWPEPFGITGIEAAFFGRPAVAFNVGGISDWLIDEKTGFLVRPYDKKAMAERITTLLRDPAMAAGMGEEARKMALEKYMPEGHIGKLLEIFGEMSDDA